MYSVFVFCLSPPEECVSSFWFRSRTFLGKPGLTEGGNVDLVFTKFRRNEDGPPFVPRRGIPAQESAHVPSAENRHLLFLFVCLFVFFVCSFLPLLRVKPPCEVSSAALKRAAQTPSETSELHFHPVRERTIYTSRPPSCRFEAAAPSGYRHLLLRPSPIAAGLLRVHAEGKPVRER